MMNAEQRKLLESRWRWSPPMSEVKERHNEAGTSEEGGAWKQKNEKVEAPRHSAKQQTQHANWNEKNISCAGLIAVLIPTTFKKQ